MSVCICTRNRPDELRECLLSIEQSPIPVSQVIVSDDSTDHRIYRMVSSEFDDVQYVEGPKRGLGANRNNAVSRASSDYVLFLDDDARLGSSFLENAYACLVRVGNSRRTIVTGLEDKDGELVYPHEQDFLGFQQIDYEDEQAVNTIVINSTLLPRALFDEVRFDELLIYGYDEVDLATQARARGFDIRLCKSAVNHHYPSVTNRDYYTPFTEASRIYVTYKRYAFTEKNSIKGAVYLLIATVHLFLAAIKHGGVAGVFKALRTVKTSFDYLRCFIRLPKDSPRRIDQ